MNLRNHLVNWGVLPPPPSLPTAEELQQYALQELAAARNAWDEATGDGVDLATHRLIAAEKLVAACCAAPKPGWRFGYGRWLVRQRRRVG